MSNVLLIKVLQIRVLQINVLLIKVLQIRVLQINVLLSSGSFCSLPCRLCLFSVIDALRSLGSCNWDDLLHVQSYAYIF